MDITATDKGLLIPRVALTARNAAGPITAPATSLLVYNTATSGVAPNNVIRDFIIGMRHLGHLLLLSTLTIGQ
jgi:hypothetical protein